MHQKAGGLNIRWLKGAPCVRPLYPWNGVFPENHINDTPEGWRAEHPVAQKGRLACDLCTLGMVFPEKHTKNIPERLEG